MSELLHWVESHWPWTSSATAALSVLGWQRKRLATYLRSFNQQWDLNAKVLSLEDEVARERGRAERAEADLDRSRVAEAAAHETVEQMAKTIRVLSLAASAVKEAEEAGYLRISPPSLTAPSTSQNTSSTSPPRREAPLKIP